MGQRDLKCLMITGAMAVVNWAVRRVSLTRGMTGLCNM